MQLVNLFSEAGENVPALPYRDEQYDALSKAYMKAYVESYEEAYPSNKDGELAEKGLKLARYLVEHLSNDAMYADEARDVLSRVIKMTQGEEALAKRLIAGEAVILWHHLARETKPKGLPGPEYTRWSEMREWLRVQTTASDATRFVHWFAEIEEAPLGLFPDYLWLPDSDLQNSGFWRRYGKNSLFPKSTPEPRPGPALVRRNGDVVVGSQSGLSVLRRGFWEWFGFDDTKGRFSATTNTRALSSSSEVLSLAETEDNVLWIGSARGLYAVADGYDGPIHRWQTEEDGLPSPRIEHLLSHGTEVLVGTGGGLRAATLTDIKSPLKTFADSRIQSLAVAGPAELVMEDAYHELTEYQTVELLHSALNAAEPPRQYATLLAAARFKVGEAVIALWDKTPAMGDVPVLIGTDTALYVTMANNERLQLTPWPVDAAVWAPSLSQIVVLRGTDVYGLSWNGEGVAGEPVLLPGQQNLRYAKQIHGLAVVQIPDVGEAIAVLTDQGLSFYRDWHFETMPLPFEQQRLGLPVGPHALASGDGDLYFLTHEGVYGFERGNVRWAKGQPVYDLVADQVLGRVYIARGRTIEVIEEDLELNRLGAYAAEHLALDREGRLIANDGHTIIRFDKNGTSAQELFKASPTIAASHETYGSGPVRALIVASDDTIWVASGGSVFRWKDGNTEEFSFFLDHERFPSRTHMISRVVETMDGKVWVVGSDEGHLSYRGVKLQGGLLEWTGKAFRRIRMPNYRMITGYTQINDDTAIVGSTAGFFRHTRDGHYQSFVGMKDPTYMRIRALTPMLWLGRRGAQIDEQSWLFPSAGGIILYHRGRWRYPDRLNQMLPDDQMFGQYGGRTTHAVAVDGYGRIYAGTDRGLLIYEASGGVASLLIDNGLSREAFEDTAVDHLRRVSDILLDKIPPESKPSRILARFRKVEQEIDALQRTLSGDDDALAGSELGNIAPTARTTGKAMQEPASRSMSFRQKLEERERARKRLLHQLENEHFELFQMLKIDPHELDALHKELGERQAVVQYLPTPQKMVIQLVTQKGTQLREVDVSAEELYRRAKQARQQLASIAKRLEGVNDLRGLTLPSTEQVRQDLTAELAWLYDQLLRPVERELSRMDHVFVVPVGPLTYVPFPALVYERKGRPKYAVERFAMGVLPSLFHLQLVLKYRESYLEESLLVGDPDGTLPAARAEVREISGKLLKALPPLVGKEATIENFRRQAPKSRIVHLATHGKLNHEQPAESYLLMANGYRLNVVDISLLDLTETDLVVLSACESGIGREGLEYATLARAFAHAHVPSVVASLWQVNDPATGQLMSHFYNHFVQGSDVFSAMAEAQRSLIEGDKAWSHPAAWSGFVVFGKP